jgi:hypothetical protein
MKLIKYMRSNKRLVIGLLILVILINASGIMERLLGMKKKSEDEEGTLLQLLLENTEKLKEGAKGNKKPPSEADMKKLREKHIKYMEKMVKDQEESAEKMAKKAKLYGISKREKELTLKILDGIIKMLEQQGGMLIFRGKPNNKGEYSSSFSGYTPPLRVMMGALSNASLKMKQLYGVKTKNPPKKVPDNEYTQFDMFFEWLERMKKVRKMVAKLDTID